MSGATESTFLSGYPNYKMSSGIRATCFCQGVAVAAWICGCFVTQVCSSSIEAWRAPWELHWLTDISGWYTRATYQTLYGQLSNKEHMTQTWPETCWNTWILVYWIFFFFLFLFGVDPSQLWNYSSCFQCVRAMMDFKCVCMYLFF